MIDSEFVCWQFVNMFVSVKSNKSICILTCSSRWPMLCVEVTELGYKAVTVPSLRSL